MFVVYNTVVSCRHETSHSLMIVKYRDCSSSDDSKIGNGAKCSGLKRIDLV